MDHKWGREVFKTGLGDMGATLASRSLAPFGNVWVTNAIASPGVALAVIVPLDTAPDDTYFAFGFGTGGLHFPYGFDVEPDGPV